MRFGPATSQQATPSPRTEYQHASLHDRVITLLLGADLSYNQLRSKAADLSLAS